MEKRMEKETITTEFCKLKSKECLVTDLEDQRTQNPRLAEDTQRRPYLHQRGPAHSDNDGTRRLWKWGARETD